MGPGLFNGTFYIVQEALNVETLTVRLSLVQSGLVNNIMSTEHIECLKHELGSIATGLIYNKDHYKLVHGNRIRDYQPLIQHSNIFLYYLFQKLLLIIYIS